MVSTNDYHSDYPNHWCPGCGNFGILDAMKSALAGLDLPPEKILIVSGIGQAAKTPHFLACNCFHSLHRRALPIAGAFNPLAVALSLGAGFVARGFSAEGDQLSHLIQADIRHRGFALIDILQPCVSFNRVNTHKWYKDRIAPIEENHNETDLITALRLALGTDDRIPTGIYHRRESPSYTDRIDKLNDKPLTDHRYRPELLKALLTDGYP